MKALFHWIVSLAVICLFASPLAAQSGVTLRVTAVDEVGGVLVGAHVTLNPAAGGTAHEVATNKEGVATFDGLTPGQYKLVASAPGFRNLEQSVTIGTGQPRPLRLQLAVEVTEVVNVEELKRPLPEREEIDQNADAINIDDDLLLGVPMQIGGDRVISFLSRFLTPAAGQMSIVVDGQEVTRLSLPARAIDEIVINKNPYSAEYRRPGRSRVEVIAQDGSQSHHHADVSFLLSSSALSARNPFVQQKPDYHEWVSEMGFSGPLKNTKGSYLFAADLGGKRTFGAVNAVTLAGPVTQLVPEQERSQYWTGRLDLEPTDRVDLTFRYEWEKSKEINQTVGGFSLPELGISHHDIQQNAWFEVNHILTANLVHKPRFRFGLETEQEGDEPRSPLVVVQGAFQGGQNQRFNDMKMMEADLQDTFTYNHGRQVFRFGGKFNPQLWKVRDLTNFGGTFEFSNLENFAANRPFVFRINAGNPSVRYGINMADAHFQDEIKLRPDFTLMLGARYDWESIVPDRNNVSPRIAFSFAPGSKATSLRGGVGIFYDRLGRRAFERVELYGGQRIQTLVYNNPAYPNATAAGSGTVPTPTIYQFAPTLAAPYLGQASIAVDRQFGAKTSFSVEYIHLRGYNQFRVLDLNTPNPATGLRPNPAFQNVIQIEPTGRMLSNSLQLTMNGKFFRDFDGSAVYTYARSYNDTPGVSSAGTLSLNLPANSFDPSQEWGRADFDRRHRFSLAANYDGLPGQIEIGAILDVMSGLPYDITTGFDNNGDSIANDRPVGVPRNAGQQPKFVQLDMRLKKVFNTARPLKYPQADPGEFELYLDAFNVLNTINYKNLNGVQSSPRFGLPTLSEKNRVLQAGLTYSF